MWDRFWCGGAKAVYVREYLKKTLQNTEEIFWRENCICLFSIHNKSCVDSMSLFIKASMMRIDVNIQLHIRANLQEMNKKLLPL